MDHRRRRACDVPVRGGEGAMKGTWIGHERTDRQSGRTFRTARSADLEVDRGNVEEFIECGRARWKCENKPSYCTTRRPPAIRAGLPAALSASV